MSSDVSRLQERLALTKTGYVIVARLGEPSFPHVISLAKARYDNRDGQMVLVDLGLEMVQALPGPPDVLVTRLLALKPLAEERAQESLGEVKWVIDVSRSPAMWKYVNERLSATLFLTISTHGRLMPSTPFWLIGRTNLLSSLTTLIARGILSFTYQAAGHPTIWSPAQVKDALVAARTKPPKLEPDQYLTETSTEDDVALTLAMVAHFGEMLAPDPWLDLKNRPVRFAEGGF